MVINDSVEIIKDWNIDKIECINRLPVGSLESIKEQKAKLGREKDIKNIQLIDKYIKSKS